jgi:hypothetical protein
MDAPTKQVLIEYVTEQKTTTSGNELIKQFCKQQPPQSLVVYRGHKKTTEIRENAIWYSASKSKQVAKDEFASTSCCVFTIHLIDVPLIDVNYFIGNEIGDYKDELECIFLGGGSFYKDNSAREKGFLNKSNGEFECWYKLAPETVAIRFDVDEIVNNIPEEEYDMITDPSDIVGFDLTKDQQIKVYDKIKELQNKLGGFKKRNKINKRTNTRNRINKRSNTKCKKKRINTISKKRITRNKRSNK